MLESVPGRSPAELWTFGSSPHSCCRSGLRCRAFTWRYFIARSCHSRGWMPLAVSPTPVSLGSSVTLQWYLPCLCHGEDRKRQLRLSACRDVYSLTTTHKHTKVSAPRTAPPILQSFSNISQSSFHRYVPHPLLTSVNDLNSCFGSSFVHSITVSIPCFLFSISSFSHWFLACLISLL